VINEATTRLQAQILRYLRLHQDAAETAAGVNCVWLGRSRVAGQVREVEQALDGLVDNGELERHHLPGGGAAYRRARHDD
jgi:hypothetical protein